MRNLNSHALTQLLDAFMSGLDGKFSRNRKDNRWTPRVTALALLILVLENTDKGYESLLITMRSMRPDLEAGNSHESSFCRARQKFTEAMLAKAFAAMRDYMRSMFQDIHPAVFGYRLLAIDGVWISGRRANKLFRQLARKKDRKKKVFKGQPQVLVVCLADVLTRTPIAWEFVDPDHGEREGAKRMLKHLGENTLLLADRGFPSRIFLEKLVSQGTKFIMRMSKGNSSFSEVRPHLTGGSKDIPLDMEVGSGKKKMTLSLRLTIGRPECSRKKNGEKWILLSNLKNNSRWTKATIKNLYHQRWGIETFFRELKKMLGADRFHSNQIPWKA